MFQIKSINLAIKKKPGLKAENRCRIRDVDEDTPGN
ncbi:Protein of unknown function [Pyronema omphalodes CBS 100304]|uniref:Uncharacterized protein n=1 Tax=Pyronema omphalodes (strain CBS 100304) TaxID=1076935 RepID=U4LS29_PYROM|nr:Protein of unknown function [Pyronema omphalodes CBS 100304]